jgi:phospholipase/carboxylesterase
MKVDHLGGLTVRLAGGPDGCGGGDGPVVVLLHGWGAPGDDLVPLAQELDVPRETRFVFPEGPLALQMGCGEARAWWMLDLDRYQREITSGRAVALTREVPTGLSEARARVEALLDEIDRRPSPRPLVLGGFSQGAMLASEVALRAERPLAGLVVLSGTLLAADEWTPLMAKRKGLRVFQSHGNADPLLPLFTAELLRDRLVQAGLMVEWVGFEGGHEIPSLVLDRLSRFLRSVLNR